MNPSSCDHVSQLSGNDSVKQTYRIIHIYFVTCVTNDTRQKKATGTRCHDCCVNGFRMHACLSCVYFGCYDEGHIDKHAVENGHIISVDIKYGNIYCHKCKDYMYNEEFEEISKTYRNQAGKKYGSDIYSPWQPTVDEVEVITENGGPIKLHENSSIGLRGIICLGHTCFVSCILQVLMHTPILRDYFLSDQHKCQSENSSVCLACEMFFIFQDFYSGKSDPYIPSKLIYLMWTHAQNLVGYDQQDAHEFFIKILDILHDHCKDPGTNNKDECDCIIDQIFRGYYQSDIVCLSCKHVSSTFDPFLDINLNLGGTIDKNVTSGDACDIRLEKCLERYTCPEDLIDTVCTTCNSKNRTKQLRMKKLPVVMCFHLKRLEDLTVKKNSSHVSFPEYLDMAPFLASTRNMRPEEPFEDASKYEIENVYCLYAVVTHIGSQAGGHYISHIRQSRNKWYKCDDTDISVSSTESVLQSEGYLLLYHKQTLEYEGEKIGSEELS